METLLSGGNVTCMDRDLPEVTEWVRLGSMQEQNASLPAELLVTRSSACKTSPLTPGGADIGTTQSLHQDLDTIWPVRQTETCVLMMCRLLRPGLRNTAPSLTDTR